MTAPPRVQDVLGRLVTRYVAPPLEAAGLRRESRRTWYQRRADGGWVLLELEVGRHATRDALELTLDTVVWPPGTWDAVAQELGTTPDDVPHTGGNAPFHLRPRALSPRRDDRDDWWRLDHDTDADALGEDLARTCLERALPTARALCDVEPALTALVDTGSRPQGLLWAVTMLERAAPQHPRRAALTAAYVDQWLVDPRPITGGPRIARLLADAGLPPRELPVWWSPALLPHRVEAEHGNDPVAAWRASSPQTLVHLADGSQRHGLPDTGLGPYGLRAEDLGRPTVRCSSAPRRRRWPWSRSG